MDVRQLLSQLGVGAGAQQPAAPSQMMYSPPANAAYPSGDDLQFARNAGVGYGTGNENFINGQIANILSLLQGQGRQRAPVAIPAYGNSLAAVTNPSSGNIITKDQPDAKLKNTADVYTAAQLAINRSPIAALGYDPRKFNLDTASKEQMTVHGAYSPKTQQGFAVANDPSALVHEAVHGGIDRLTKAGLLTKEIVDNLPDEESLVRYIMASQMGDPEKDGGSVNDSQRQAALELFQGKMPSIQKKEAGANEKTEMANKMIAEKRMDALQKLEKIAADYIAKQRPGGPR